MIADRSPIVGHAVAAITPLALLIGTYLLFAGHNNPGGGFAAGLVFGAVLILRTIAGVQKPVDAPLLMAAGLIVIAIVTAAPIFWGDYFGDQAVVSAELPILGKIKSGSALPFDIGVTAIVIGLVASLLDGLSLIDADGDLTT